MDTWERLLDVKVLPSKYRQLRVAGYQSSPPPPTDKLLISIRIVRLIRQYFTPGDVDDDDDHNNDYTQHTERSESEIFELHRSNTLREGLSRILPSIGIPIDYHSQILPKIISQLAAQSTRNHIYDVPFLTVVILIGTLRMPNEEDEMIRRATEESMIDTFKPGPASRSSIEALEKAKFVQGLDYSSIMEADQQCMICLEKLINTSSPSPSPSPAAVLKYEVEQVTRMPCLHLYHGHCIVRWLETSNVCPVCRFQMPTTTT